MTDPLYLRAERVILAQERAMQQALEARDLLAATIAEIRRRQGEYYNALAELDRRVEASRLQREALERAGRERGLHP